ncbi:MAG: nucleotide pyrophosphohydrolase [Planctomycetaceae bacterium]|nr:nucleotide pyrophosphohydrolase [Planctomycetaceae bacterium]
MAESHSPESEFSLDHLQPLIDRMYSRKDEERGVEGTFMWLMEEVGELSAALREGTREELAAEFADVLAWLATIANISGIDLREAVRQKYSGGCPGCGNLVCACGPEEKP